MNTKCLLALCFFLLPSAFCLDSSGQSYSIDWFKVGGGGGTIGQHDAGGLLTGGNFSLIGGFRALYTLQTPGAPVFSIRLAT